MTALSAALATTLLATLARAETPDCSALAPGERERAVSLMDDTYIHDCCDLPLSSCLEQQPACLLAERLADNICRRVGQGQEDELIQRAMKQRSWSMVPSGDPLLFDLEAAPSVGDPESPVQLVVFAAPRGFHCARVVPGIHEAVTAGPLQGKVQLHAKLFPLRSNEHGKEAGLAFLAAHQLGAFWEFALHGYAHFDGFSLEAQLGWAEAVGLDIAELERRIAAPALLDLLAAHKREGVDNGIESTPAFFIDGHPYRGELEVDELIDVLEEAWERSMGFTHSENPS